MPIEISPGQVINGIQCQSFQVFGDIVVVWGMKGTCKVFEKENFNESPKEYLIQNQSIKEVAIPQKHELLILKTDDKEYFRDFKNQAIEEANEWADYYFEPHTSNFFRKDARGIWYDIEGYRLDCPVFKIGSVICSLHGKTSRESLAFKNEHLIVSPGERLIQVGKLVLDVNLDVVLFFGEKITGLGSKYISFGETDVLQEVRLGLNRYAFVNEYSGEPFLINNEEIVAHMATVEKGSHHYEVFRSGNRTYVVEGASDAVFQFEGKPALVDLDSFLLIGKSELVCVEVNEESFYIDVNSKELFGLDVLDNEKIRYIDPVCCRVGSDSLHNVKTDRLNLIYNISQKNIYTINEDKIQPDSLVDVPGFEAYYAYADYDGDRKLIYKKHNCVVQLGKDEIEVKSILSTEKSKLIVAKNLRDEPIVLDARKGFDQLELAVVGEQLLVEVLGEPFKLSGTILQNVMLKTLGGSTPRVVDLNNEALSIFTLPSNLSVYPDQYAASGFQNNEICKVDYEKPITKGDTKFYPADFISYFGNSHSVLLYADSGKPLQLDGAGHRNELVTGFNMKTFDENYFLGEHHMVGAYTLTEDLKENEILFSLNDFNSWLPFYDAYLPIFRRVIEAQNSDGWNYLLFELREISGEIEYAVVEKEAPYRIWAIKQGGKPAPKLIKQKEKDLKSPEAVSKIRRILLLDNSYLAEV